MSNYLVVYNSRSGNAALLDDVKKAFARHGVEPTYIQLTAKNFTSTVRGMRDRRGATVVAVGGDGTINAVANELQGSSCKLGIIPAGTLNHFAKALRVPASATRAVANIMTGEYAQMTLSTVNDRAFINNSSIGFYPQSLRVRDQYGKHIGKWPAAALGVIKTILRPHHYRVQLVIDGKQQTIRTPFVFIGNNPYKRTPPDFGERATLTSGQLGVYVVKATSVWGLLRMLAHALFTKKRHTDDFSYYATDTCTIRTRHHHTMRVACDGEVLRLQTPLHYRAHPNSLRVIVQSA
jgi:YegS/Rv2252/BmrU family lipid kinase